MKFVSKDNEDSSDDDALKYLRAMVPKSGFSLESDVAKIMSQRFSVRREVPFYDKDGKEARAIDIGANYQFPDESKFNSDSIRHIGSLNLTVECKNLPGNIWLFSEAVDPGISIPNYLSLTDSLGKEDPTRKIIPTWIMRDIPLVEGYDEFVFDESKNDKKTKNPNDLYSAIHVVIKATHSNNEIWKKTFGFMKSWEPISQKFIVHFGFFQPVIIFSGKLFIAKHNEDKLDYKQVPFVQLSVNYRSEHYDEHMGDIHIVTFANIEEYLERVIVHYSHSEQQIVEMQEKFRDAKKIT